MSEVLDRQTNVRQNGPVGPVTPARLMLLFDRLLTSGSLYPPRHVNFTVVTEEYQAGLDATGGFTAIESGEDLRVGSDLLGPEIRGVERLAGFMRKLGLHRIDIRPGAREEDLHRLATTLMGHRREADASGHLAPADFGDLPETIKVVPRVFATQWGNIGASGIGEIMDDILENIAAEGATEARLRGCRATLGELFDILMSRDLDNLLDALDPATRPQDAERPTLTPAGALELVETLRRQLGSENHLLELAYAVRETLSDREADIDRSAVRVLLKAMEQEGVPEPETSPVVDPRDLTDDTLYTLPLTDLRRELASFEAGSTDLAARSDWEDFFVCLAILQQDSIAPGTARAMAEVTHFVEDREAPENEPLIQQAVSSLLKVSDVASVDRIIEIIATVIRQRSQAATVTFWTRVCAEPRPGLSDAVWPHLVCEMLTAQDGGRELLLALPEIVGSHRAMSRPGNIERLEKLKAFSDPRGGAPLFRWPERSYFPVYAALLRTSRAMTFGTSLQSGLASSGPDPQIRSLAEALGPYRHNQAGLYRGWLTAASNPGEAPPRELLETLRHRLTGLDPAERSQSWVAEAVATIGQHGCEESRKLLKQIASERRFLVIPAWPLDAREAAERALRAESARNHQRQETTP